MDWQGILGAAGVILALASAAGIGLTRAHVGNLRTMIDDQAKRITFLEKEDERHKSDEAQMRSEIERLKDHEGYLASVVKDKANYTAISDQVEAVAKDVVAIKRKVGAE